MLLLFKAHWSRGRDIARKVPGARHEVSMTYDCAAAVGASDTHRVNAVGYRCAPQVTAIRGPSELTHVEISD